MKLIAILRDPVERAWSHYRREVRRGPYYYSYAHHHFSYFDRSRYAYYLKLWLRLFPWRQLLLLRSDALLRDANRVANEVFAFLGLPPHHVPPDSVPEDPARHPSVEPARRKLLEGYFAEDQKRLSEILESTACARSGTMQRFAPHAWDRR